MQQAKVFKVVAYSILIAALLIGGFYLIQVFVKNPVLLQPK